MRCDSDDEGKMESSMEWLMTTWTAKLFVPVIRLRRVCLIVLLYGDYSISRRMYSGDRIGNSVNVGLIVQFIDNSTPAYLARHIRSMSNSTSSSFL